MVIRELSRWKFPPDSWIFFLLCNKEHWLPAAQTLVEHWSSFVLAHVLSTILRCRYSFWLCRVSEGGGGLRERGSDLSNEIETKWRYGSHQGTPPRISKNEMFSLCCFDVGPTSATSAQHQNNIGCGYLVRWYPWTSLHRKGVGLGLLYLFYPVISAFVNMAVTESDLDHTTRSEKCP